MFQSFPQFHFPPTHNFLTPSLMSEQGFRTVLHFQTYPCCIVPKFQDNIGKCSGLEAIQQVDSYSDLVKGSFLWMELSFHPFPTQKLCLEGKCASWTPLIHMQERVRRHWKHIKTLKWPIGADTDPNHETPNVSILSYVVMYFTLHRNEWQFIWEKVKAHLQGHPWGSPCLWETHSASFQHCPRLQHGSLSHKSQLAGLTKTRKWWSVENSCPGFQQAKQPAMLSFRKLHSTLSVLFCSILAPAVSQHSVSTEHVQ